MIDLHTHSNASDGSLTPTALANLAVAAGLSCMALTDHNTVRGLEEFLSAAAGRLWAVPGIEVTAELEGEELHILALDLPRERFGQMQAVMDETLRNKEEANRAMTDRLRQAGYAIDYDAVCRAYPGSVINRSHVGRALTEAGYTSSVQDAFARLLDEGLGFYVPPARPDGRATVSLIRELGAVPVWAHPLFRLDAGRVRKFLEILTPAGLTGMEVWYSTYSQTQTADALALAEAFGLKPSGGSDFHGASKPDIRLGVGRGNLNIPEWVAHNLLD